MREEEQFLKHNGSWNRSLPLEPFPPPQILNYDRKHFARVLWVEIRDV
jgi:hypothetical protein